MLINRERGFCFIAVPKTGTSSISKHLASLPGTKRNELEVNGRRIAVDEHVTAHQVIRILGRETWDGLFTFACVRNPWDRAVSLYHFFRRGRAYKRFLAGKQWHPAAVAQIALANLLPFRTWVKIYPGKSAVDYLIDEQGLVCLDEIFQLENLNADYARLCERLGIAFQPLDQANRSEHKPFHEYYDAAAAAAITRRHIADIEHFGYSCEPGPASPAG